MIEVIKEIAYVEKEERIIALYTKGAADQVSEFLKAEWSEGRGQITGPFRSIAASDKLVWHVNF